MMSRNDKFNKLVDDLHQDFEVPDSMPSWNAVESKLKKRRQRRKVIRRLQVATCFVCASLLISILVTTSSSDPRAYASFSSFFKNIQNNIIEIFIKKPVQNPENALTSPPPSEEQTNASPSNASSEKTTLAEAQNKLAFTVMLPSSLPDQFSLAGVRIFKEADDQYRSIYLEYTTSQGSLIKMTERLVTGNTGIKAEIHEGTGEIKDVYINGHPAVLMILSDGMINLEWIVEDIKISLSGILAETEAIDWAKSVK